MKTLQELYTEIIKSDELKKAFAEAAKSGAVIEFAKAHGVETTQEEIKAFFQEKKSDDAKLSAEELENAAGGQCLPEGMASYYGDYSCTTPY